jgi:hypothetical protein
MSDHLSDDPIIDLVLLVIEMTVEAKRAAETHGIPGQEIDEEIGTIYKSIMQGCVECRNRPIRPGGVHRPGNGQHVHHQLRRRIQPFGSLVKCNGHRDEVIFRSAIVVFRQWSGQLHGATMRLVLAVYNRTTLSGCRRRLGTFSETNRYWA